MKHRSKTVMLRHILILVIPFIIQLGLFAKVGHSEKDLIIHSTHYYKISKIDSANSHTVDLLEDDRYYSQDRNLSHRAGHVLTRDSTNNFGFMGFHNFEIEEVTN